MSCQAIFQQSVKKAWALNRITDLELVAICDCILFARQVVSQPQAPQGKAIIRDVGDMMSLALKCVYSCER